MQTPHERIQQLRIILAVHSYIYYELCDSLVSDHKWQQWANELRDMQKMYPEYTDAYASWYSDWNGSTGYHLCSIKGLHGLAMQLLRLRK